MIMNLSTKCWEGGNAVLFSDTRLKKDIEKEIIN